jgi:hypothetical protein
MSIKELFQKDIYRTINGVVYADKTDNDIVAQELDEYVLTTELKKYINQLFSVYNETLKKEDSGGHMGVWISGFFGSGKSHFLKILSYLFENRQVKTEAGSRHAIDFFREKITDGMAFKVIEDAVKYPTDVILFNIDSLSFQNDEQAAVLKAFFGVFNRKRGFCFLYPHIAHVESFLVKKGVYEDFKKHFATLNGSTWENDREDYVFYSDEMLRAIREVLPNQSENSELEDWITNGEKRYPLTIENFAKEVAEYIEEKGRRLLFMVDEMGQFIGSHSDRMLNLQTIVENLGTQAKGKAWVFVTSQEDIDSVLGQKVQTKGNDYSKIQARFFTRLSLSSSSIAEVIQKRILQKTPGAETTLKKTYASQRDILLNQLSFGPGTPSMHSFDTDEEFSRSYPFVPYQFNLLQDIFDAIRSVGATGLNLSKGERSMLEAFQTALKAVGETNEGALVPLYSFFPTVQSFLDGSVARSIYNAEEIAGITEADLNLLKALFLIRYLRIRRIPGTIQNLSVLCLPRVDTDMVIHRKQIEDSLIRLEKENLVTREENQFIFLTIEEQNITKQIQNTTVPPTKEIKELAGFLFRDQFDGKNKYRHTNGKSFDIQLSLDSYNHSTKGDLLVEFYSPLSGAIYETKSANPVLASAGTAQVLVILPDDNAFFNEFRLYLRTDAFITANAGKEVTSGEKTILEQKASENIKRRNKLLLAVSDLVAASQVAIAGTMYQPKAKVNSAFLMDVSEYLVRAVYTKLDMLADPAADWERTIRSLLVPRGDMLLDEYQTGNPIALEEIRTFLMLSEASGKSVLLSDFVQRYGAIPFGWPDGNAQVLVAYLFRQGEVKIRHGGKYMEPSACVDLFVKSSLYEKVTIERCRVLDNEILEAAGIVAHAMFDEYPPTTLRELSKYIKDHLAKWEQNLRSWRETVQHDTSMYPGIALLKELHDTVTRLQKISLDDELLTAIKDEKDDLVRCALSYHTLESFFSGQIRLWREAARIYNQAKPFAERLSGKAGFMDAFSLVGAILSDSEPWAKIKDLSPLANTLEKIQEAAMVESRAAAIAKVDAFRESLTPECEQLKLSPEKTYEVKAKLNRLHDQCAHEVNLAQLEMVIVSGAESAFNDALNALISQRQTAQQPKSEPRTVSAVKPETVAYKDTVYEKQVETVRIASFLSMKELDTPADVDTVVEELRSRLKRFIAQGKKIRLE